MSCSNMYLPLITYAQLRHGILNKNVHTWLSYILQLRPTLNEYQPKKSVGEKHFIYADAIKVFHSLTVNGRSWEEKVHHRIHITFIHLHDERAHHVKRLHIISWSLKPIDIILCIHKTALLVSYSITLTLYYYMLNSLWFQKW